MAKPAKGRKALKKEQKAVKVSVARVDGARKEPVAQKEVRVEQPKKPEVVVPASTTDKAIAFIKANFSLYTIAIVLLIALMFYLRTLNYDAVFTTWPGNYVNVAEDDGVYHLRLLFNTLQHFPFRILYDPFTRFPYGNTIHFGPLFELIPATFLYIVGLGNPSSQLVTTVAAYYPAVLGALLAIPVYYMGKKLFGRGAGLLDVAVLALMPGAILWRSMLGEFDHHIAEVFFMACTVACLIYALDAARESRPSLEQIRKKDYKALKAPLIYGALTGIFMGAYLLNWPGAVLLSTTIFLYFVIQALIDHSKGESLDYILVLSTLIFAIPTLMILPYCLSNLTFQSVYYSLTQPVMLLASLACMAAMYVVSGALKKGNAGKWSFPAAVLGMGAVGILVLYLLAPGLFGIVQYGLGMLNPSGNLLTVAEAWPTVIDRDTGAFTLAELSNNYQLTMWTSLLGIFALGAMAFRSGRQSMLAFLIWNIVMTIALISQNRFLYYYGVNAALLTAGLAAWLFGVAGFDKLKAGFLKAGGLGGLQRFVKKNTGSCATFAVLALLFIFIAVYPATPMSDPRDLPTAQKVGGILLYTATGAESGMSYEWYDALTWMRDHTPDPQGSPIQANFDYASGQYYPPAANTNYSYPASAYGVMSWWDYGHMIEYVAQRIPNANPFQAGVLEQNGTTGAAPYFASTDEAASVRMLDQVGSRYVIINNRMASGIFGTIQKWTNNDYGWDDENVSAINYLYSDGDSLYASGSTVPIIKDSKKWNDSIVNRLYYGDADGMGHYRLVYESAGPYYINIKAVVNGQYGGVSPNPIVVGDLKNATEVYDMYSQFAVATDSSATTYGYGARPPEKYVKIFEKVAGATLTGSAPDGTAVTASLALTTDWGRSFNYTATAVAHNGTYSLTVPYPTEQMKGDGYSYGIVPQGKYTVTYGGTTKSVDVPESAVMNGATIRVA